MRKYENYALVENRQSDSELGFQFAKPPLPQFQELKKKLSVRTFSKASMTNTKRKLSIKKLRDINTILFPDDEVIYPEPIIGPWDN